jgi:IS5 family transposase
VIGTIKHQSSLFYVAFGNEASLIKDDLLDPIDTMLEDPDLIERVADRLGKRSPRSRTTGRPGIAPDRLLRCAVLRHIKQWSFRELERELRCNLVYRRFTRFDHDRIPDHSNMSRAMAALDPETVKAIHTRLVEIAVAKRVVAGRKMRTDTTVVETNVHHPTDSTLLGDGIRVLQRSLQRVVAETRMQGVKVVDHARATRHRILEIHRAARLLTDAGKERMKDSYGKLVAIAKRVVRQAETVVSKLARGKFVITGSLARVTSAEFNLQHFTPLVQNVIAQTRARVFDGDTRFPNKLLSLFETHTVAIRKGKAHKPTEFGRLTRIDEVENGVVSNYEVAVGNPADVDGFIPAVSQHKKIFGRAPRMATADRGYYSASNERDARAEGVERVVLPGRGRLSQARGKQQKERWFQRGLAWRAGVESRIATLKHRFDMARVRYKGADGFERGIGWSVIAQNLVSIARTERKRRQNKERNDQQQHAN